MIKLYTWNEIDLARADTPCGSKETRAYDWAFLQLEDYYHYHRDQYKDEPIEEFDGDDMDYIYENSETPLFFDDNGNMYEGW